MINMIWLKTTSKADSKMNRCGYPWCVIGNDEVLSVGDNVPKTILPFVVGLANIHKVNEVNS